MTKLQITLTKSTSGANKRQIATVEALGLKRIGQTVEQHDNKAIRGMISRISHLVSVVEE
ncbi:MAG TPA: 50S ribosomal protein L30 [Clostridiaceae bacterium]|nr:50S ribosomal protein L30 [Clostridiaceae bacterium]